MRAASHGVPVSAVACSRVSALFVVPLSFLVALLAEFSALLPCLLFAAIYTKSHMRHAASQVSFNTAQGLNEQLNSQNRMATCCSEFLAQEQCAVKGPTSRVHKQQWTLQHKQRDTEKRCGKKDSS